MSGVEVTISDLDFPEIREVDLKLIELARALQGKIVTNDFNLNKVAQLRGVDVLNVNELANSLKPVVLPGEIMKVFILKEGKEYNQGVAYLDDGTMVVVDNARKMISKTIDIVVTSVLQTTAGKMIFGRFIEAGIAAGAVAAAAVERAKPAARSGGASRRRRPGPFSRNRHRYRRLRIPPYHWWRTVFYLIPAITLYTIVLGAASIVSSLFDRRGYFAHGCARAWSWLILKTTGVRVTVEGLERITPGTTYVFVSNHQSIYDIPVSSRRCRISCGSSPRSRWRGFPVLGWHLKRGGHLFVDRRHPDRAGILKRWRALVAEGLSLIILPKGRAASTGASRGSRRAASCWRSRRSCRSCRWRSSGRAR